MLTNGLDIFLKIPFAVMLLLPFWTGKILLQSRAWSKVKLVGNWNYAKAIWPNLPLFEKMHTISQNQLERQLSRRAFVLTLRLVGRDKEMKGRCNTQTPTKRTLNWTCQSEFSVGLRSLLSSKRVNLSIRYLIKSEYFSFFNLTG